MADLPSRAGVVDIEGIIARLRGVSSARVVTDERGHITEIHVVADESRHPKQLSRDIESALLSELGVRIDHRVVSIAQMRGGRTPAAEVRLKFLGIDYSLDRNGARVRVTVGMGERITASRHTGRSERLIARHAGGGGVLRLRLRQRGPIRTGVC
jgi:hypothetical protein